MTELETAIRDALRSRADEVEPRQTELRGSGPRRHTRLLVAAAVIGVLAVAGALVALRNDDGTSGRRPPAAGGETFVGYSWRVVEVTHGDLHVTVPGKLRPFIGFGRDGQVEADDTVNSLGGGYRLTPRGYATSDVYVSAVGFRAGDPGRTAIIDAVDAALDSGHPVTVTVHGSVLTLDVHGYELTLTRSGAAPDQTPPSPTST